MKNKLVLLFFLISISFKCYSLLNVDGYLIGIENYYSDKYFKEINVGQDDWTVYIEGLSALITNSYTSWGNNVGDVNDIKSWTKIKVIGNGLQWRFTYKRYGTYDMQLIGPSKVYNIKVIFFEEGDTPPNEGTLCIDDIYYSISDNQATVIGCKDLINLNIPETINYLDNNYPVIAIKANAFENNIAIESVSIPSSIANIGIAAFHNCSSLKSIFFEDSNDAIYMGLTNLFNGVKLEKVYIGRNLTYPSIGNTYITPFYVQPELKDVEFSENVTTIPAYLFYNCESIQTLTLPNSLTSIGNYAFYQCTNLEEIIIPNSVTSIGYGAFKLDNNLKTIVCKATQPPICVNNDSGTFANYNANLFVPIESIELYRNANIWKYFTNISPIDDDLVSGVENINVEVSSCFSVYDLNGKQILTTSNKEDILQLPKGIYIINGKKHIIR